MKRAQCRLEPAPHVASIGSAAGRPHGSVGRGIRRPIARADPHIPRPPVSAAAALGGGTVDPESPGEAGEPSLVRSLTLPDMPNFKPPANDSLPARPGRGGCTGEPAMGDEGE